MRTARARSSAGQGDGRAVTRSLSLRKSSRHQTRSGSNSSRSEERHEPRKHGAMGTQAQHPDQDPRRSEPKLGPSLGRTSSPHAGDPAQGPHQPLRMAATGRCVAAVHHPTPHAPRSRMSPRRHACGTHQADPLPEKDLGQHLLECAERGHPMELTPFGHKVATATHPGNPRGEHDTTRDDLMKREALTMDQ